MSNEFKDRKVFTANEIPGLVRKKPTVNKVQVKPESSKVDRPELKPPEPVAKLQPVEEKPVVKPQVPTDPTTLHEELISCLVEGRALMNEMQAAADTYYTLCSYVEAGATGDIPSTTLSHVVQHLCEKDPNIVFEVVEAQAKKLVDGWRALGEISAKAVTACDMLNQYARNVAIDEEMRKNWNADGCCIGN